MNLMHHAIGRSDVHVVVELHCVPREQHLTRYLVNALNAATHLS